MVPEVSVVVATHNRPESLAALMRSLAGQTLAGERFEVIVVDDGSDDPREIERATSGFVGLEVRLLRHPISRGPAAARNTGWRAARAPLVALTDDDCRASRQWLSEVLKAGGNGEEGLIVQGRVEPAPEQRAEVRPLSHTLEVLGLNRLFMTCNVAYPRRLLERVGGLDESFLRACGEDVDLGARAVKAGGLARFADNALVYHEVRQPDLKDLIRHTLKWTDSVRVMARHPELRELLVARVFWKRTHVWLFLVAAGVGLSLRTRRMLPTVVASGPYLEHYRRLYAGHWCRGARALPTHVVIDVFEIITALWGSARHRTLML